MPIPDFWGGGGYEGKWALIGDGPAPSEDIWLDGQKVDLTELLRPPTHEERRDLTGYYQARENYRANFIDRFGEASRYTGQDIENLTDLVFEHKSGYSEVTVLDLVNLDRSIRARWFIQSEYERWRIDKAGWEEPSDYYKDEFKP